MELYYCPRCGQPFDEGGVYYIPISRLPFNLNDGKLQSMFPDVTVCEHYYVCEQCAATIREVMDDGLIR